MQIPGRFQKAIDREPRNCILVVGAGLSRSGVRRDGSGIPDWDQLMNLMVEDLSQSRRCDAAKVRSLQYMLGESPPRYLDVAEEFAEAYHDDMDGYETFLRKYLMPDDLIESETHNLILQTGFKGIITYNFDLVFEKQLCGVAPLVYPELMNQIGHFQRNGFFAKIHGCISRPAKSLVLTSSSYNRLERHPNFGALMHTLFLGSKVLCVGFSLRDPAFLSIIRALKRRWKKELPPLFALMRDPGEDERKRWLAQGVDILPYENHDQVGHFLSALRPSSTEPSEARRTHRQPTRQYAERNSLPVTSAREETREFINSLIGGKSEVVSCRLGPTCENMYTELIAFLKRKIIAELVEIVVINFGARVFADESGYDQSILYQGNVYSVAVGIPAGKPHQVEVCIIGTPQPVYTNTIILDYAGRFGTANLSVPYFLIPHADYLAEVIRDVLDTGDRAIEEYVLKKIALDTSGTVSRLYSMIRRKFDPGPIADSIRLFILDPSAGGGMTMDDQSISRSMEILRQGADNRDPCSPVERVLRLAVTRFPIEQSVASRIVPSLTTVVRSPLEIPSADRVGLIQDTIFGNALILHPLVNSAKVWIEAGYPAEFRSVIEPVLNGERCHFASEASLLDYSEIFRDDDNMRDDQDVNLAKKIRTMGKFDQGFY